MTGLKPLRVVGIVVVVTVLGSAVALAASGSSLKIVLPANAHVHHKFTFSIKGTFSKNVSSSAWVIVLDQAKTRVCASTEPKDWKGQSGDLVSPTPEHSSPFTLHQKWYGTARKPLRLCAYSYSQMLTSLGNAGSAQLLATAQTVIPK